jgi:hypothetical protein
MKPLDQGTTELTKRYKKMTPGQKTLDIIKTVVSETIMSGARPGLTMNRRQSTVGMTARKKKVGVGAKTSKGRPGGLHPLQTSKARSGQKKLTSLQRKGTSLVKKTASTVLSRARETAQRVRLAAQRSSEMQRTQKQVNPR